jgi:hypothetical protein
MKLENLQINKVTVHKIFGKSKKNPEPYAGSCKELVKLGDEGMQTLNNRISSCLNHKSKFYELHLSTKDKDSFFEIHKPLWGSDEKKYLEISQQIADKAANAHKNANIPDGLLIVLEGKITNMKATVVIKAEKSDAFSMTGTDLQLVKDIFLSSDKTLYKIGFAIHRDEKVKTANGYNFYVYDDAFSPSKEDLAYYFYSSFLGLSTEKNSKLLTNKLHRQLMKFVMKHIGFGDKYEVMRNLDRAFLDPARKILHAKDFISYFPNELADIYRTEIEETFPTSFIKDNAITTDIETKRIELSPETTLLLKNAPDGIITGNTANDNDVKKLQTTIDSGIRNYTFALIPTQTINPSNKV